VGAAHFQLEMELTAMEISLQLLMPWQTCQMQAAKYA
jgi:hypothetical protein